MSIGGATLDGDAVGVSVGGMVASTVGESVVAATVGKNVGI